MPIEGSEITPLGRDQPPHKKGDVVLPVPIKRNINVSEVALDEDDVLSWCLDDLLPDGGYMVLEVSCYFDESGTHHGSQVLCVGGYCFEKQKAKELNRKIKAALQAWGISYFRMTDCAHKTGQFKDKTKEECIRIETRLIELIHAHAAQGIAVTINEQEFDDNMPNDRRIGDAYACCAHLMLCGIRAWIQQQPHIDRVHFVFEAGHKSQSMANQIMNTLFQNPVSRKAHRYVGHLFMDKKEIPLLQTADLLAWQCHTDRKHTLDGRPQRKDFIALRDGAHHVIKHLDGEMMQALNTTFEELSGGRYVPR